MDKIDKVKQKIDQTKVPDLNPKSDSVKAWEDYKDLAQLWQSVSMVQFVITIITLILAILLYLGRNPIINVPEKPLPGIYAAYQINDVEFIDLANDFVNLVYTYQPINAKRQFTKAAEYLLEPFLTKYNEDILEIELQTIFDTSRSQIFFNDPSKTVIERVDDNFVKVTLVGERLKIIGGKQLPNVDTEYVITFSTIPRNVLNQYGIVIIDVESRNLR